MKLDLHTHYYPPAYFERIVRSDGDYSFGASPTGQRIIRYKGARFFGVTAPMTDVDKRLEDMDRVGIDVEVLSLSTPNVFFAEGSAQTDVARMVNDAYADLIAKRPGRFLGFASIPMDDPAAPGAPRVGLAGLRGVPREHRRAAVNVPEAPLLRHGDVRAQQPAAAARRRRHGPPGDGERLPAPSGLDRQGDQLDRGPRLGRNRKGAGVQRNGAGAAREPSRAPSSRGLRRRAARRGACARR